MNEQTTNPVQLKSDGPKEPLRLGAKYPASMLSGGCKKSSPESSTGDNSDLTGDDCRYAEFVSGQRGNTSKVRSMDG